MLVQLRTLAFAALISVLTPTSSYADVLEVGVGGSRWVAGGGVVPGVEVSGDRNVSPSSAAGFGSASSAASSAAVVTGDEVMSRGVPAVYAVKVAELSARYDLSPALIEALVWQESRWRAHAVSPKGARGLAQLMPGTARDLGVDADDPFANLEGGARYLRAQLDRFGGDIEKALAAYNAGPGRVERARGIPRIRETQEYVAAIMTRLSSHSEEK